MNLRARVRQSGRLETATDAPSNEVAEQSKVGVHARASVAAPSRLIAICSPIGSHGRSTIAAAISDVLGRDANDESVLLVDADTKAPAQHILHGITEVTAGVLAAGRLARLDRYTADEHQRLVLPSRGYRLLNGIQSLERWSELDEHACNRLLLALRQNAATLVFDVADELDAELVEPTLGNRRNQFAVSVIDQADVVVLLCNADPISLGRLPESLKTLEIRSGATRANRTQPRLVIAINRMRDSAIGSDARRQIEGFLDSFASAHRFELAFIPDDQKACDSALQAGEVVTRAHPRSSLSRAVRGLVAQINSSHVHTSRAG
jgi:MinD-like ATPase involved in chromosome partitioning or flagellar assembly